MRCLIIDDEKPARDALRRLLAAHPELTVAGEAADVETALAMNLSLRPEVVFLDIRLRGEEGFDFLARLAPPEPRIVFVTAHDRYAVRGFECNALDYLLKPVHPRRLALTVERLRQPAPLPPPGDSPDDTVLLKLGGALRFVRWREITRVVSEGNYTRVFLENGSGGGELVLRTLKQWSAQAPAGFFIQVHRNTIVRRDIVCGLTVRAPGRYALELADGTRLQVSRQLGASVRARLAAC